MPRQTRRAFFAGAFLSLAAFIAPAAADTAQEIKDNIALAERQLYAKVPGAKNLAARARGVLIMPKVIKGGFVIGGSYGEGALKLGGAVDSYYSVAAASIGYQIGVQRSSHALFFMTQDALDGFKSSSGWELGVDAEFTVPGDGLKAGLDTTTVQSPVILLVFAQDGLLAGASLEGAKYSRIAR